MRRARCSLRWILLVLSLSSPRAALADGSATLKAARAAFNEASSFARQGRWSAACDRYELSLSLHPSALTLYSLGVAQREAGRPAAARASFRGFLAEPVTPTTQAFTGPARAAIVELTLLLAPAPPSGAASSAQPSEPSPSAPPAARREPWPPALPFVLLGAGGAAIAGGVTLGLVGLADAEKSPSATGPAAGSARAKGIAGDALAGGGIVAAGVGLVLLVVQLSHPALAIAHPWIHRSGAGLSIRF